MRKLMRYVWLMPALFGLMVSCASDKTDAKALEGAWNIVEVDGEAVKVEAEEAPFIGFDMSEMSVHGKTDCNLFNASFELKPNDCSAVQLGEIITTMMACPEDRLHLPDHSSHCPFLGKSVSIIALSIMYFGHFQLLDVARKRGLRHLETAVLQFL